MIKVKHSELIGGSRFHYAHFMCDCLFIEIINEIYNYKEVYREKNLDQTIGNFEKIYTEVMHNKNIELYKKEFDTLNAESILLNTKEHYLDKQYFEKFRHFIFTRYNIQPLTYDEKYPEVLLVKRGSRINLIDDKVLSKQNKNITTGKERREIRDIDNVESYLTEKYQSRFKAIFLENMPFEEQVKYFNNCKFLICAHGAAMTNMFFCKEKTKILEVTCNKVWRFFDIISNNLNLIHSKCSKNNYTDVINMIEMVDNNEIIVSTDTNTISKKKNIQSKIQIQIKPAIKIKFK